MTLVDMPGPGVVEVTVTELEMTSPADLKAAQASDRANVELVRSMVPSPELSRFFYRAVGGRWFWVDRLAWSFDQWAAWVNSPGYELTYCTVEGTPAGYVELERQGSATEIAYFGLMHGFAGQGLGGWLLTKALEQAWSAPGTERVWVHTCSLDGPHALANYMARGLRPVRTYAELRDTSRPTPGPWLHGE